MREWQQKYAPLGLAIVGVHAPEFTFARNYEEVARAIAEFQIPYPVVVDNDFAIWQAYSNRYWPAHYLIDAKGLIRYYHFGEGAYGEAEEAIHNLLLEANPSLALPPIMDPVRERDAQGAYCYAVTPELYMGYTRGRVGNPGGFTPSRYHKYRDMGKHAEGYFYLEGEWIVGEEHTEFAGIRGLPGSLTIRFTSKEVNLVLNPSREAGKVTLYLDSAPIAPENAGADVLTDGDGQSYILVDRPRMYRLLNLKEFGQGELTITTGVPGMGLYAFTFVSCVANPESSKEE